MEEIISDLLSKQMLTLPPSHRCLHQHARITTTRDRETKQPLVTAARRGVSDARWPAAKVSFGGGDQQDTDTYSHTGKGGLLLLLRQRARAHCK